MSLFYLVMASITYGFVLAKTGDLSLIKQIVVCTVFAALWPAYWGLAAYIEFWRKRQDHPNDH